MSLMTRAATSRRTDRKSPRRRPAFAPSTEGLEGRALLALVGVELAYPTLHFNSTGKVVYDADTKDYVLTATPTSFQTSESSATRDIVGTGRSFEIRLKVDNTGKLVGGVSGSDLTVKGSVDINGNGTIDYSGTLLTGEIQKFGFLEDGTVDYFDFSFRPTGGPLACFYTGKDVNAFASAEAIPGTTTFNGSFANDFTTGAKGDLGSGTRDCDDKDKDCDKDDKDCDRHDKDCDKDDDKDKCKDYSTKYKEHLKKLAEYLKKLREWLARYKNCR